MVLKRSAPARRWASAAVSSGSTATGAAAGWRERNVKVRSSTTAVSTSTRTSSAAPMVFFMVREGGATAPVRQEAPSDHSSITLPGDDLRLRLRRRSLFPDGPHRVREGDLLDRDVSRRRAARGLRPSEPRARRATVGFRARGTPMRNHAPPRGPLRKPRSPGGGAADHAPGTPERGCSSRECCFASTAGGWSRARHGYATSSTSWSIWAGGSTSCTAAGGATPRSRVPCRGAICCGGCGRAGTSPNETSCGRFCELLAPVEIFPCRRQHVFLRGGERALE